MDAWKRPQAPTGTPNDFNENLEKIQKNWKISNFQFFWSRQSCFEIFLYLSQKNSDVHFSWNLNFEQNGSLSLRTWESCTASIMFDYTNNRHLYLQIKTTVMNLSIRMYISKLLVINSADYFFVLKFFSLSLTKKFRRTFFLKLKFWTIWKCIFSYVRISYSIYHVWIYKKSQSLATNVNSWIYPCIVFHAELD